MSREEKDQCFALDASAHSLHSKLPHRLEIMQLHLYSDFVPLILQPKS